MNVCAAFGSWRIESNACPAKVVLRDVGDSKATTITGITTSSDEITVGTTANKVDATEITTMEITAMEITAMEITAMEITAMEINNTEINNTEINNTVRTTTGDGTTTIADPITTGDGTTTIADPITTGDQTTTNIIMKRKSGTDRG